MAQPVLDAIRRILSEEGVDFREVHHEEVRTSEAAARARAEPLRIGGKALLVKAGSEFRLCVLSASRKLDSQALKKHLGIRSLRFASADELLELTGLVPGSVPPFGRPILPFTLHADPSVLENDRIAFNAGSLTDSVILRVEDWVRVAKPEISAFARGE